MPARLHTCQGIDGNGIPDGDIITTANDTSFDFLQRTGTSAGVVRSDTLLTPPGFDNSYKLESVSGEECNLRTYDSSIIMGQAVYLYIPSKPTVATTFSQVRSITVGAFSGRAEAFLMIAPDPTTTVASGSNGANLTGAVVGHGDFSIGTGVIDVANTNTNRFSGCTGDLGVATISIPSTGTTYVISYTGKTTSTFTGCQWISGSGTIATGATVTQEANLRLSLPASFPWVTELPYPIADWFKFEWFVVMGTTNTTGQLHGGLFYDPLGTVPDAAFASTALDTGIISERVQYEVMAEGRCSSVVTDVTSFQWLSQTLSGDSVGSIGTNGFLQPDPEPDPDPDPEPPPPAANTGRVSYFVFDGVNLA